MKPQDSVPLPATDRPLIEDIRPTPVKERSPLGVVELTLDEGQSVRAIGVVYGIEHIVRGEGFRARVFLDQYSQRLKVGEYEATDHEALVLKLRWLAEANGFDKITIMASADDWERFLGHGYVLEAILKYYRSGADALVVSKFRSQERLTSGSLMDEILLIEKVMADKSSPRPRPLPVGCDLRLATRDDIPELIQLYQSIFETYPTPLIHSSYLEAVFQEEAIFAVCTWNGRIAAAASAELHPAVSAAELTDCSTRPDCRSQGLISHILTLLEGELRSRDYVCAYTMARARSFGMNYVFHRLGYEFNGRLVNNCDIFGAYEDMNIWVKNLSRVQGPA